MIIYYTGIGSRKTPYPVCKQMTRLAEHLETRGFYLRSGGADRADLAFESGVRFKKDIYLPWQGFNKSRSGLYLIQPLAFDLSEYIYNAGRPNGWSLLTPGVKRLMARNSYQVLGFDLATPSKFVVCWTPDGCQHWRDRTYKTGGTGQAIHLASYFGIPVFNLARPDAFERLDMLLEEIV